MIKLIQVFQQWFISVQVLLIHVNSQQTLAPVENLVRIGTGIDAGDVAFSTFYGEIELLKIEPIITDKLDD